MEKVLTEGLHHNIGPSFDIMFAQLEVIPRTRNKLAEIITIAERYLITTHVKKNVKSKKQSFRICFSVIIHLS